MVPDRYAFLEQHSVRPSVPQIGGAGREIDDRQQDVEIPQHAVWIERPEGGRAPENAAGTSPSWKTGCG